MKWPGVMLVERQRQREVKSILSGNEEMRKVHVITRQRSLVKCMGGANKICLQNLVWLECNVEEMCREETIFSAVTEIHMCYADIIEHLCRHPADQAFIGRLLSWPTLEGLKSSISCLGYSLRRCLHAQLMTSKVLFFLIS